MPQILDVEQALLLLELEAPFEQRDVQLARRRMAKRWHPDIAPPTRRHEHQRHLQAVNEAADQLEQLAESIRGGRVSRNAVKASAAAARQARAEAGRRAYEADQRSRAAEEERQKHDPFGARVPDHSVVHRYARCLSYPEWGVGTVTGIYFSGDGDDVQQWARMSFNVGVRTVPAGSLQFVDFSKPDQAADRVTRFMTAAQHALAEGNAELAAQRLVYARDADPANPVVLRLLTAAFWQAGNLPAAARAVRDWARVDTDRPTPERFAARIYEDMGAIDLAAEAAERAVSRAPSDGAAWERLGRLRLRMMDRASAIWALERARELDPTVEGLLDLALAYHLAGNVGAEVSATEAATRLEPDSPVAWSRYAHALARTDRLGECAHACERTLALRYDAEVDELLVQIRSAPPRTLPEAQDLAQQNAA
jgi:tetratricopeptide (TPR) repeat protein